jgi:hypothetical protein
MARRLDAVFTALVGQQQLHADPEQQHRADDLQVRVVQQLDGEQRQHDAQHDRRRTAEEHGLLALAIRQAARGQRDHHRVVTRQQDVDPDDLAQGHPEGGVGDVFHAISSQPSLGGDRRLPVAATT